MTDLPFQPFADDAAIRRIGEGLLGCTLPKAEWTHEAHLAACLWLLRERPEIDIDGELGGIISRDNESAGGVNDDEQGYHETITRCFLSGVRLHLSRRMAEESLADAVNALLARRWESGAGRSGFIAMSVCSPLRRGGASSSPISRPSRCRDRIRCLS